LDHFELFISYHWRDHADAEKLARRMRERGLSVFVDRWYFSPGQSWPGRLEEILAAAGAVAVCVGANGLGAWQQREQHLALDRQAREPGFPVIPVLLPGSQPPLGLLRLNTWVDLRHGTEGPTLDLLAAAARRETPTDAVVAESRGARASICPYRGLLPFREEDTDFFRGRELVSERLRAMVAAKSVVAVVGASGSGKSSLVRAGLIPSLRGGEKPVWEVATMVPTDRPLQALAEALIDLLQPGTGGVDRLAAIARLGAGLADRSLALRDLVGEVLRVQVGTDRLLLLVDQWEELHTLCADEAERQRFVATLLEAVERAPLSLVLTLRGDFYGSALSLRVLAEALQDAVVNLGPMTQQELARAVAEPAERARLRFEGGLVERILDDVGQEPGHLPLLEFLLEELWRTRRGDLLHHEAYVKLGGVRGALTARAEALYQQFGDTEKVLARRLLMRLVRLGSGPDDTRRPAPMPSADDAEGRVAQQLVTARLLVFSRAEGSDRQILEVAHEALIRGWDRLRQWLDADRELLRTRERVAAAASQWLADGRAEDRLLPPGRPLEEGRELLRGRRAELEPDSVELVEASLRQEREQRFAREEKTRKRLRNRTWASVLMAGLAAFSLYGWHRADTAERKLTEANAGLQDTLSERERELAETGMARDIAEQARERADRQLERDAATLEATARERDRLLVFESRWLATRADAARRSGDAVLGTLLALRASPDPSESSARRPLVGSAIDALARAAAVMAPRRGYHMRLAEEACVGTTSSRILALQGRRLLLQRTDGIWRWDLDAATQPPYLITAPRREGDAASATAERAYWASAEGGRLLVVDWPTAVELWDVGGAWRLLEFRDQLTAEPVILRWAPAAGWLVLGLADGTLVAVDGNTGRVTAVREADGAAPRALSTDAAGSHLLVVSAEGDLSRYRPRALEPIAPGLSATTGGALRAAAVSPAGDLAATLDSRGSLSTWALEEQPMRRLARVDNTALETLWFGPDNLLVGRYEDGRLLLFRRPGVDLAESLPLATGGSLDTPGSLFTANGRLLMPVTAATGNVELWDAGTGVLKASFAAHKLGTSQGGHSFSPGPGPDEVLILRSPCTAEVWRIPPEWPNLRQFALERLPAGRTRLTAEEARAIGLAFD
jgi:KaiC/GvpD/RAD55 family RecA-like ATPase